MCFRGALQKLFNHSQMDEKEALKTLYKKNLLSVGHIQELQSHRQSEHRKK
jgi:hypothetical protein